MGEMLMKAWAWAQTPGAGLYLALGALAVTVLVTEVWLRGRAKRGQHDANRRVAVAAHVALVAVVWLGLDMGFAYDVHLSAQPLNERLEEGQCTTSAPCRLLVSEAVCQALQGDFYVPFVMTRASASLVHAQPVHKTFCMDNDRNVLVMVAR